MLSLLESSGSDVIPLCYRYYEKKYAVFKAMYGHQKAYDETMHLEESCNWMPAMFLFLLPLTMYDFPVACVTARCVWCANIGPMATTT